MPPNRGLKFWQILVGLLIVVLVFNVTALEAALVPLILAGIIFYGLRQNGMLPRPPAMRSLDSEPWPAQQRQRQQRPTEEEVRFENQDSSSEPIYSHAIQAVHRAGIDPNETMVLPVDIGVMAFRAGDAPTIYRSQPVSEDIDYLQPFIQLRVPQRAMGRVKFELVDGDGQTLFIHEDLHQLQRGRNLVMPSARLPIHDALAIQSHWRLRVSADDRLLAEHRFFWQETAPGIRPTLAEDGEISPELRTAISQNERQSLSLDDLLSDQEDEPRQQRRR